jgi:acetolactate synthase small subunit
LKKIITKYNKLLDEHERLKNRKNSIIKSNDLIVTKINKFENDILEIKKSINIFKNELLDINKKISELEKNKTQELENKKIPSLSIFSPVIRKLTNEIDVLLDYKKSTNIE